MHCLLPDPYPDELLYSVIARHQVWAGITNPRDNIERCFGLSSIIAVHDLPCHISRMIARLPESYCYSEEDVIRKHTLYSFYTAFMMDSRRDEILEYMKGDKGGGIHMKTGAMASAIPSNRWFRYCPICATEDLKKHGEMYWHRLHQTPGVEACPLHRVVLKESSVLLRGHYLQRFIAAEPENCPEIDLSASPEENEWVDLAADIQLLYQMRKPLDTAIYHAHLIRILKELEFVTKGEHLRLKAMSPYLQLRMPNIDSLKILRETGSDKLLIRFIEILRNMGSASHPLYHLLLIRTMYGSFNEFLTDIAKEEKTPTGYPCYNAASDHYKQDVITRVEHKKGRNGKSFWHYSCECGFRYSASELGKIHQRIKVIQHGPIWEEKLHLLIEQHCSIREISRALKSDQATIRAKIQAGLSRAGNSLSEIGNPGIIKYREQWRLLIKTYPDVGVKAIRAEHGALYSRLYKYDKAWLIENLPKVRTTPYLNKFDWCERDKSMRKSLELAYGELVNSPGKPIRITRTYLTQVAGCNSSLGAHFTKLPSSVDYLNSVCETVSQYRIGKIPWAAQAIVQENKKLNRRSLLRKISARSVNDTEVLIAIEAFLKETLEITR